MSKIQTQVFLASDHAGFDVKAAIAKHLENSPFQVHDVGTFDKTSVDYPDFAGIAIRKMTEASGNDLYGTNHRAILVCGTGQGMAIRANRHPGIRAAICWNVEIAGLAREHNNANVLCLPGRYLSVAESNQIVDKFLTTHFAGGRHLSRIEKLDKI